METLKINFGQWRPWSLNGRKPLLNMMIKAVTLVAVCDSCSLYFTPSVYQETLLFSSNTTISQLHYIHLLFPVRTSAVICNFYGSSFPSHPHPAIFSCTKRLVLQLDVEHVCLLPYYFNVLSLLWTHWFVKQTVLPFTPCWYSSRFFL